MCYLVICYKSYMHESGILTTAVVYMSTLMILSSCRHLLTQAVSVYLQCIFTMYICDFCTFMYFGCTYGGRLAKELLHWWCNPASLHVILLMCFSIYNSPYGHCLCIRDFTPWKIATQSSQLVCCVWRTRTSAYAEGNLLGNIISEEWKERLTQP